MSGRRQDRSAARMEGRGFVNGMERDRQRAAQMQRQREAAAARARAARQANKKK